MPSCLAGLTVSLAYTKCDLSVVSDLKMVQMPCCSRQRRSRPVARIFCGGGGGATEANVDQTIERKKTILGPSVVVVVVGVSGLDQTMGTYFLERSNENKTHRD